MSTDAFDVVRALFSAINQNDADAAAALYDVNCQVERVFPESGEYCVGRESARSGWARVMAERAGGLPGGFRFDVSRIAGIETGWGWVRADWRSLTSSTDGGDLRGAAGYSYFWIEDGLIRRQRNIARELPPERIGEPATPSERRYPSKPLVGVGAVVLSDDGKVLLVKRRHEPLAAQWSLPGGMLELGESLEAGVAREIEEETGLSVGVGAVVDVFDRILLDDTGQVRYHFVLVDYICHVRGGSLAAGSDVSDVAWADPQDLDGYHLAAKPRSVITRAIESAPKEPKS
ncbi:MAG TPA: NUDIX hydrolase [Vicinamibacterales bacterium]|nr:NUDIX hydrolase [Vicinamibacterales bacterium]